MLLVRMGQVVRERRAGRLCRGVGGGRVGKICNRLGSGVGKTLIGQFIR